LCTASTAPVPISGRPARSTPPGAPGGSGIGRRNQYRTSVVEKTGPELSVTVPCPHEVLARVLHVHIVQHVVIGGGDVELDGALAHRHRHRRRWRCSGRVRGARRRPTGALENIGGPAPRPVPSPEFGWHQVGTTNRFDPTRLHPRRPPTDELCVLLAEYCGTQRNASDILISCRSVQVPMGSLQVRAKSLLAPAGFRPSVSA
jgi:hypothetical protein